MSHYSKLTFDPLPSGLQFQVRVWKVFASPHSLLIDAPHITPSDMPRSPTKNAGHSGVIDIAISNNNPEIPYIL